LQHLSHVERIVLDAGNGGAHALTLYDINAASADDSHVLTLVGSAAADTIDGSAVKNGDLVFNGGGRADVLTGGNGADTFVYSAVSDSTGNAAGTIYDTLVGFDTAEDLIDLPIGVVVTDVFTVASGTLSSASFNTDMTTAVGALLGPSQAVLFHADAGSLAGHDFLLVNPTTTAGYHGGSDFVFDVTGYAGAFSTSAFI
jgi:Ca2+-binding RTX toxin-like protein